MHWHAASGPFSGLDEDFDSPLRVKFTAEFEAPGPGGRDSLTLRRRQPQSRPHPDL